MLPYSHAKISSLSFLDHCISSLLSDNIRIITAQSHHNNPSHMPHPLIMHGNQDTLYPHMQSQPRTDSSRDFSYLV